MNFKKGDLYKAKLNFSMFTLPPGIKGRNVLPGDYLIFIGYRDKNNKKLFLHKNNLVTDCMLSFSEPDKCFEPIKEDI